MFDNLLVLLEVAFFQSGCPGWYDFQLEAMFNADVDYICDQYNFTSELPESEIVLTSYGEIRKYGIRNEWHGEKYLVIEDDLDNFSIYQFGFEE